MKQKSKIIYITYITFFALTTLHNFGIESEYRFLQEWRARLEHEKEEEKKEETWSSTFYIGLKQIVDQTLKITASVIIGGLASYLLIGLPDSKKHTIAGAIIITGIVGFNWKFHSPVQKRIIQKEARKIMIKEISNQIEKMDNQHN